MGPGHNDGDRWGQATMTVTNGAGTNGARPLSTRLGPVGPGHNDGLGGRIGPGAALEPGSVSSGSPSLRPNLCHGRRRGNVNNHSQFGWRGRPATTGRNYKYWYWGQVLVLGTGTGVLVLGTYWYWGQAPIQSLAGALSFRPILPAVRCISVKRTAI